MTTRIFGPLLLFALALPATARAQDFSEENLKQADPIAGEQTWQQYCAFCHTLREGQGNMAGPNLFELFKRGIGNKEGYAYSDALANADREWTPEFFAEYVQNPAETLPGNNMAAVNIPEDRVIPLTAFVMRATGSVDWDAPQQAATATGGLDAELKAEHPEFWEQYMTHTVKFTLPRDNGETYSFVAYFNDDGTITGNNRGLEGIWRMRDKRSFCYSLERVGVHPYEWMHCLRPKAEENLEFGKVLGSFAPVKGHEDLQIEYGFIEGRPHPLEGDAHPEYWTFLFNNITRYEINVDGETHVVDARFNRDNTITSEQGVTGEWHTTGPEGREEQMCYYFENVPGVDGKLNECFALVLMFNPRVGARWPSRFDEGVTYWAETVAP